VLAKQTFCRLSHTFSLFCSGYCRDGVLWTICLGWPETTVLLISASQVVRITGVSYWHPTLISFFILVFASFYFLIFLYFFISGRSSSQTTEFYVFGPQKNGDYHCMIQRKICFPYLIAFMLEESHDFWKIIILWVSGYLWPQDIWQVIIEEV
jgi:hypothetical protein